MPSSERSYVGRFFSSQFASLPYPSHSFSGQVIIVTGANTGLGLEAARHFVRLGAAKVILGVRNEEKGKSAQESISSSTQKRDKTEVWLLNMESQKSVKEFAEKASRLERLDAFVANAGVCTNHFELVEGIEKSIAVNVLYTFLLVFLLLPTLRKTALDCQVRPRVVIVSSEGHETTSFSESKSDPIFAVLNDKSKSNMDERYDTSKLLQIYGVRELATQLDNSDKPAITVNACTPGLCRTSLLREAPAVSKIILGAVKLVVARSAEVGSRILVHAAETHDDTHGQYLRDCKVTP
ncbi:hypothetical protein BGW36DRAFT_300187 [Talaromyces proteolyticus]|uniref:Short-chain dehydrogenase n=1 Tax=Talaromyces proteolyticus TaxID=1131652 RepID=A0AAD4KKT6_9EURO|nr:uncharacterized protein BGW36DRAFT_300187 [Talaromyces proteolyticus]KAH8693927.1 hypothetical protein BGW36DRAFT_300187 [Talaromyces proteolyticus]